MISLLPARDQSKIRRLPKSILVIKLSAMGDVLCLMPSVRMISIAFPMAKVDWLTTERANPTLFQKLPFISKIILVPTNGLLLSLNLFTIFRRLQRYDLIIDCDQYYLVSELFSRLGRVSAGFETSLKGTSFTIKCDYEPELNEKYQFKKLFQHIITLMGVEKLVYNVDLPELLTGFSPTIELRRRIEQLEKNDLPILVIYPGSSSNALFRRWSWSNYQKLIDKFRARCEIVIAGGADEIEISRVLKIQKDAVHNWIGMLTLVEWTWFFQSYDVILVGNDGGLLHVAEAAGQPSIGIYGPSLSSKWGSVHRQSIAIERDVECRPCLRNYLGEVPQFCWKGTVECLAGITIDAIAREVELRL